MARSCEGADQHPSEARCRAQVAVLVILLCAAAGLALRLYDLGGRPLWVDEAATWAFASLGVAPLVNVMAWVEPTPPSYYLLMKAWMSLGDGSEFWLRLSSALISAASILLFGVFLWRAFGPVPAGWGAALLAIAGGHVRYAQEARVYSAIFMLFVLGLLLMERLVNAMEAAPATRRLWGFAAGSAVTAGLMINLHISAAIAAATIYFYGLCLLLLRQRASVRRVGVLVASGTAGLILATPSLRLALSIAAYESGPAYWFQAPDVAGAFLEFQSVLLAPHLGRLASLGAALSLLALGVCFWAGRRHPQTAALAAAFAFSACAFYAVSKITPILMGRTVLFTLALTLAMVAYGISRLKRPLLVAAIVAAAFLPQIKGSANLLTSPNFYGQAWAEVARFVSEQAEPRDAILTVGSFEAVALDYYLLREGSLRTTAAVGDREGGLNTLAITLMTQAVPLNRADLDSPACKGVRSDADIWLVSRGDPSHEDDTARVQQRLRAWGSEMRLRSVHGSLFVEHWSPPTRCR